MSEVCEAAILILAAEHSRSRVSGRIRRNLAVDLARNPWQVAAGHAEDLGELMLGDLALSVNQPGSACKLCNNLS